MGLISNQYSFQLTDRSITLLDTYLIKELLGPFFFGMIAFSSILVGSTVLIPLMSQATQYQIPLLSVLQLLMYQMPAMVAFSFPMSMLLSSILAFGRLSGDLEIIAFRSGGISFFRLLAPVVVVGLMVSMVTIWFNESIVPRAAHSAETLMLTFQHRDTPTIKKNINVTQYDDKGLPQRIINVLEIDEGILKSITVAEYEKGSLIRLIRAEKGRWLEEGGWEFLNGVMHYFPPENTDKVVVMKFGKEVIGIKLNPLDLKNREKRIEEMNAFELHTRIKNKTKTGQDPTDDAVKFHMKFAVPFASLIFSILGACIGVRPHRSSSAIGLGISLIIILAYYVLIGFGIGAAHFLTPVVAAWLPNILVGFAGYYFLKRLVNR